MIVEAIAEDFAALVAGAAPRGLALPDSAIAPDPVLRMLEDLAARIRREFAPAAWLIVEDGELVGMCSITRPPAEGAIDIGYGIAPTRQGRGAARRAIGTIVRWAVDDPRVSRITAETGIANLASQRVLERNGFLRAGNRTDPEDGDLICWARACAG